LDSYPKELYGYTCVAKYMAPVSGTGTRNAANQLPAIALVRVISGNRVTLPEKVVKDVGIHLGDELMLIRQDNGWLLTNNVAVQPAPA
jgi:hypothetical protein